jgi:uroporphyrin-III C-methyltransferase / precorrin-2 dehydrogenase / sirohydrochlorin ferrochelatase
VRFVTGHNRYGRLPSDIDWRACADPAVTTIFYMGAKTAARASIHTRFGQAEARSKAG